MFVAVHKSGRTYLIPENKREFNTEYGLIKVEEGTVISSTGETFLVLKADVHDLLFHLKRGPQIAHWKDLGLIVSLCGIRPGYNVLEVGGGSGFSTLFWSLVVGEKGKVVTYERNSKHLKVLLHNIELAGVKNVEVRSVDVRDEPPEKDSYDFVFLDIPDPEGVIDMVEPSLKKGGYLSAYLPTVEQLKRLESAVGETFTTPKVYESIVREWKLGGKTRPLSSGIIHTAFVFITRKIGK